MATLTRLEQILHEVRAEIEQMLLSNDSGFVGIHVSAKNELRKESNRNGEKMALSAWEMDQIRQRHNDAG